MRAIDLRAPVEFEDDHLDGAVNVPLFENETRSFVGLLYKQFSPDAAFNEARAAVVERIDGIVARVADVAGWQAPPGDHRSRVRAMTAGGIDRLERDLEPRGAGTVPEGGVVLMCARGGLRSRSVVALLRALGLERAVGLEGGYRAIRHDVMAALERWSPPGRVVALRGLTGVGKTLLLRRIEELRPGVTLDLEGLAGHRGSLLGMVGLRPVTQKSFESALAARLREGFTGDVMVVEGESRKVGDSVVPARVWDALQGATNVEVVASVPRRVEVLSEDYLADPGALPRLREQLDAVAARMDEAPPLAEMLDRGETDALVELLLERYYDPLYRRSESGRAYAVTVDADDVDRAAREVLRFIDAGGAGRSEPSGGPNP